MLNYMSANAIRIFREKAPVSGAYNEGVSLSGTTLTVDHNVWKNAVAFETYKGDRLAFVSVMGTGRQSGTKLQDVKPLPLPERRRRRCIIRRMRRLSMPCRGTESVHWSMERPM